MRFLRTFFLFAILSGLATHPALGVQTNREATKAYNDGTIFYKNGQYEEAIAAFQRAIKLDPTMPDPHYALGMIYQFQFKYKSASEEFAQAIRLAPAWINLYLMKMEVDIGRGQPGEAEVTGARAVEVKPNSAEANYWLGRARMSLGKYEEAIRTFQRAIELKPNYAEAYTEMGMAYSLLKRNEEALKAYQSAIESNPKYALAHLNLARLYIKQLTFPEAREQCQILKSLGDPNLLMVETQLARAERLEKAKQVVRAKPNDTGALVELGLATMDGDPWIKDDRFLRAKELFQQAIKLNPNFAEAHLALGTCYVEMLDVKSAQSEHEILQHLDKRLAAKLAEKIKEGPVKFAPRVMTPDK